MINATYYEVEEASLFQKIVGEKQSIAKGVLGPIHIRVISTFSHYLNEFATISARSSEFSLNELEQRTHLIGCYKNETASSRYAKGQIFEVQPIVLKELCPYCMLDRPKTLDHYIPKDEFPEYAMFVKNLVPCCYDCNNKKDENWRNGHDRQFIHFYNDLILNHQFLFSELLFVEALKTPQINHYLQQSQLIQDNDFQIVKAHYDNLNLLNAYNNRLNSLMSAEIEVIKRFIDIGTADEVILGILNTRHESMKLSHGVNYYMTVFYQTLERQFGEIKIFITQV